MSGAITGANPLTSMRSDIRRINSLPDAKSREIALAITTPIEPVKPCKKRATSKTSILGAIEQRMLAITHKILPMMSGFFSSE